MAVYNFDLSERVSSLHRNWGDGTEGSVEVASAVASGVAHRAEASRWSLLFVNDQSVIDRKVARGLGPVNPLEQNIWKR